MRSYRDRFCLLLRLIGILAALECIASSPAQAQLPPIERGDIVLDHELLVRGAPLQYPLGGAHAGDGSGRLFVVEKPGVIRVLQEDEILPDPFLDITDEVVGIGERGLLNLAFHPDFADPQSPGHHKLYTYHSTDDFQDSDFPREVFSHQNVVTEWQVDLENPNRVDPTTRREVMRMDHARPVHNGSTMVFDKDDYLYVSIGDPTSGYAQDPSSPAGSILRIDPLDPPLSRSDDFVSANGRYRIPATNPHLDDPDALDEIYAHGLRNPWRGSIDRETGVFWIGDVGEGRREEVNVVVPGGNYGWPKLEGTLVFRPPVDDPSEFVAPYTEYEAARAVIGGYVYRGEAIPWLNGLYVFGDLTSRPSGGYTDPGPVYYLDPYDEDGRLRDPSEVTIRELAFLGGKSSETVINSFAEDESGELYLFGFFGGRPTIRRLTAGPAPLSGDYNGNGRVEQADLDLVLLNWGDEAGLVSDDWINDLPRGIIDQAELDRVLLGWGSTYPTAATDAVPEPVTWSLLAAGIPFVYLLRQAQRSS